MSGALSMPLKKLFNPPNNPRYYKIGGYYFYVLFYFLIKSIYTSYSQYYFVLVAGVAMSYFKDE